MVLTKLARNIIISIGVIVVVSTIAVPSIVIPLNNDNTVTLTLLYNAGIMIEYKKTRIYVDPYQLDVTYTDLKADYILITHPHADHYQPSSIRMIEKEDTVFIMPEQMKVQVEFHDAIGVNPEEVYEFRKITITPYYMYTLPEGESFASHPQEFNWTSFIIDINGFTVFHAGDSKDIPEYDNLAGLINVACLPLGPSCQTMYDMEVVDAINSIEANYFIPIHYGEGACPTFIASFGSYITSVCELIHLEYWATHVFEP